MCEAMVLRGVGWMTPLECLVVSGELLGKMWSGRASLLIEYFEVVLGRLDLLLQLRQRGDVVHRPLG